MMIDRRLSSPKRGKKMEVDIRAAEDFLSSFKADANSAINLKLGVKSEAMAAMLDDITKEFIEKSFVKFFQHGGFDTTPKPQTSWAVLLASLYERSKQRNSKRDSVTTENDIFDKGKEFHPEFTHQLFGDNETIFGYSGLQVQLYYHSGSLLTYLGMTYDSDVNGKLEGIEAEPVLSTIAEQLPPGFYTNLDDFIAKLPSEGKFRPMGELLYSYQHDEKDYEIYFADIRVPKFKEYHSRLQTFLLWYIDAASFIETDDERWNFYFLFEKKKVSGEIEYSIVGYMTVYHYYAYPDKLRPRISQMLVLPPFQKQGHGAKLLNTVEEHYIKDLRVLDITVEDPSDYFIRLRDKVDALACSKLECFSPDVLKKGFTADLASKAQKTRKMNKMQCRRVYEILRLKATDRSNTEEYRNYRLDVKKRLNAPYQKEKADADKLKKVLSAEEMTATLLLPSPSEQRKHLEQLYEELEECYLKTIERIASS